MEPFLIAFLFWAILHSLTAGAGFKRLARRWLGDRTYAGLYRLLYNIVAGITFLPVLYLAAVALPDGQVWRVPWPASLLLRFGQLLGLLGLAISLWQTDLLRFAGLGQAIRYLRGAADVNPPPVLVTSGPYALVRHPLYLFSLIVLWLNPVLTWQGLIFNGAATLYFWIGSVYEERRLVEVFGSAYQAYRRRVPRLLPLKWPARPAG
jgi:protein-S-isoprenylcysteine O-methyltransferase Ste14